MTETERHLLVSMLKFARSRLQSARIELQNSGRSDVSDNIGLVDGFLCKIQHVYSSGTEQWVDE